MPKDKKAKEKKGFLNNPLFMWIYNEFLTLEEYEEPEQEEEKRSFLHNPFMWFVDEYLLSDEEEETPPLVRKPQIHPVIDLENAIMFSVGAGAAPVPVLPRDVAFVPSFDLQRHEIKWDVLPAQEDRVCDLIPEDKKQIVSSQYFIKENRVSVKVKQGALNDALGLLPLALTTYLANHQKGIPIELKGSEGLVRVAFHTLKMLKIWNMLDKDTSVRVPEGISLGQYSDYIPQIEPIFKEMQAPLLAARQLQDERGGSAKPAV